MGHVQTNLASFEIGKNWRVLHPYSFKLSTVLTDPVWDSFVVGRPDGHHVQTSLWAQLKAFFGWDAMRLIVTRDDDIVAGAQLLLRRFPLVGAVGYVSRGPLLVETDKALAKLVVQALQEICQMQRILFLVVQPARDDTAVAPILLKSGFQPSARQVAPTATILIDLSQELDDILAQMHKKTRYGIRRAQREGIVVRQGGKEDLDACYQLIVATARRNQFTPFPKSYYEEMWRLFAPHGYITLFLAQFKGELVSAHLVIPFGDTLLSKMAFWSGEHGKLKPNELLEWEVIQWAKAQGYRYYDFEGINLKTARLVQEGKPLPESLQQTAASFKLGFSRQIGFFPGAYEYVCHPFLRWIYQNFLQRNPRSKLLNKAAKWLRL
jgi:lipid II:glycine glycyltransferase (peptidoglycan interpeptide bridge formation enzyme)